MKIFVYLSRVNHQNKLGDIKGMIKEFVPIIKQGEAMREEYPLLREFLEEKTSKLWRHEVNDQLAKGKDPKNAYQSGFSPYYTATYNSPSGVRFFLVWTATFGRMVFDYDYYVAFLRYPDLFGTGNADDVLLALFENINKEGGNIFDWDVKKYSDYLQKEECCYIVKKEGDSFSESFLRIDLFRMICPNKDRPELKEFVGGLFHVLDHFAINNKNLGTSTETFNVSFVDEVVLYCIEAFAKSQMVSENEAIGIIDVDDSHQLKISFYKETESGAFYIKTAHPIRRQEKE